MTRGRTTALGRGALVVVGVVIGLFGIAQLRADHIDTGGSNPAAVLTASATHGAQALAERPVDPAARLAPDVAIGVAVTLASLLLLAWFLEVLTDLRRVVPGLQLQWHRRGPPVSFTA